MRHRRNRLDRLAADRHCFRVVIDGMRGRTDGLAGYSCGVQRPPHRAPRREPPKRHPTRATYSRAAICSEILAAFAPFWAAMG